MSIRVALAVFVATMLVLGTALASDHSGTVLAVDSDKGTIVIGEVGPWRTKDGQTEITRQTVVVEPSTQFVLVKRTREPGPSGWPGGFVEEPLGAWAVKGGDFVTVRVEMKGRRPTATRVLVTLVSE
jgi:hypothetical protein